MIEFIEVTTAELLQRRANILARNGIPLTADISHDCGCCPSVDIPWVDFDQLREIAFLLGED